MSSISPGVVSTTPKVPNAAFVAAQTSRSKAGTDASEQNEVLVTVPQAIFGGIWVRLITPNTGIGAATCVFKVYVDGTQVDTVSITQNDNITTVRRLGPRWSDSQSDIPTTGVLAYLFQSISQFRITSQLTANTTTGSCTIDTQSPRWPLTT